MNEKHYAKGSYPTMITPYREDGSVEMCIRDRYGEEIIAAYRVGLFGRAASLDNGSVLQASRENTAFSSEKIGVSVAAG